MRWRLWIIAAGKKQHEKTMITKLEGASQGAAGCDYGDRGLHCIYLGPIPRCLQRNSRVADPIAMACCGIVQLLRPGAGCFCAL